MIIIYAQERSADCQIGSKSSWQMPRPRLAERRNRAVQMCAYFRSTILRVGTESFIGGYSVEERARHLRSSGKSAKCSGKSRWMKRRVTKERLRKAPPRYHLLLSVNLIRLRLVKQDTRQSAGQGSDCSEFYRSSKRRRLENESFKINQLAAGL